MKIFLALFVGFVIAFIVSFAILYWIFGDDFKYAMMSSLSGAVGVIAGLSLYYFYINKRKTNRSTKSTSE